MFDTLKSCTSEFTIDTFGRSQRTSERLLAQAQSVLSAYCSSHDLSEEDVCFFCVGSVGRQEALDASDVDFIPVVRDNDVVQPFMQQDEQIRMALSSALQVRVSKGQDLTRIVTLPALTDADSIGGDHDDSSQLTKRILLLTEAAQAGGRLPAVTVRKAILNAYAGAVRSRGRHVLSLCNDLARYYRTLCIEYKAKIDVAAKDWATRNMKLRHSRKLWYLSCILATVAAAAHYPEGQENYTDYLLDAFSLPPWRRLLEAVPGCRGAAGRVLDDFAWFVDFMGTNDNRMQLAAVDHSKRNENALFKKCKENSDQLHQHMIDLIDSLEPGFRRKVLDWFLL